MHNAMNTRDNRLDEKRGYGMKHLLKLADLSKEEILDILDTADQLKKEKKQGIPHPILQGKALGMIFRKSSSRGRMNTPPRSTDAGLHSRRASPFAS